MAQTVYPEVMRWEVKVTIPSPEALIFPPARKVSITLVDATSEGLALHKGKRSFLKSQKKNPELYGTATQDNVYVKLLRPYREPIEKIVHLWSHDVYVKALVWESKDGKVETSCVRPDSHFSKKYHDRVPFEVDHGHTVNLIRQSDLDKALTDKKSKEQTHAG